MVRLSGLVVCLLSLSVAWGDDESAVRDLTAEGATVVRDESKPGQPIRLVRYPLRLVTVDGLGALKELEDLPAIEFIGSGGTEITSATLRALQGKPSLKRCSLSLARISDESAAALASLHSLQALDLRSQVECSEKGLQILLQMHQLQEVSLSDRLVNDELLQDLGVFPNLKVLNVRSMFVTDKGLTAISRLPGLQTLRITLAENVTRVGLRHLADMPLKRLEITYFNAADADVKELRGVTALRKLQLMNASRITDAAIPSFSEMPNLKELELVGATLSRGDIKRLKTDLADCQVTLGRQ
ncbi:MAG: hypothetical protein JSS49_04830 [Planctomycetes bacterium]|nr:hypothetical protein [Planctomycetota bacterium]